MSRVASTLRFFSFFISILLISALRLPDPDPIIPPNQSQPVSSTIPAFPEESNESVAACSLDLPDQLFTNLNSACGRASPDLHYSRCCPVLATWLYSAYSATALARAARLARSSPTSYSNSLPLLPDDSETCVDDLDKAMAAKGIRLSRPNQTCDLTYCYCGIRLRPLRCPEAFRVDEEGRFVGDQKVKKLESDCLSDGFSGPDGCSKCLRALNQLDVVVGEKTSNSSSRSKKMHHSDCQIMGATWLLAKNRSAYIHTVSGVLRSIMNNVINQNIDPTSCTLGSDGMPLAVDSNQIGNAYARKSPSSFYYLTCLALLVWLCYTC
ncbi:unnamed protein product [Rhodiola kirilowii]